MKRLLPSQQRFRLAVLATGLVLLSSSDASTPACDLDCQNGGQCKPGRPVTEQEGAEYLGEPYCHCPTGYDGPLCEIKFVLCGDETDRCYNGENCTRDYDDNGAPFYHCQCDVEATAPWTELGVRFCEHASTVFCKSLDHNSIGPSGSSYCANAGRCLPPDPKKSHAGCDCPPRWTGNYCQVPADANGKPLALQPEAVVDHNDPTPTPTRRSSAAMALLVSLIVLGSLLVLLLVQHGVAGSRRARLRRQQAAVEQAEEEMEMTET